MCFVHGDYEWIANISHHSDAPAEKETTCDECGCPILVGQMLHHIYQQEYEECRDCEEGDCSCERDKCCQCKEPDVGNTCDYDRCDQCDKFLQAVEDAEVAAGCSKSDARPALGEMRDDISNGGRDEARKYFVAARRMFPELVASGYLHAMWQRIFPNEVE
jgi:hypothetical protein